MNRLWSRVSRLVATLTEAAAVLLWVVAATAAGPSFAQPTGITCGGGATLQNGRCVCPTGMRNIRPAGMQCVPACAPDQQLSPDQSRCVARTCNGGMVLGQGGCACPAGTKLGPQGKQCVAIVSCPPGQFVPTPGAGCQPNPTLTCMGGAVQQGDHCACPAGTRNVAGGDTMRCAPACADGQQLSPDMTSCVARTCTGGKVLQGNACVCPAGTKLGPQGQECVKTCPAGQMLSPTGSGACVAIPTPTCEGGATPVNGVCTCPAGTRQAGGANGMRCVASSASTKPPATWNAVH